MLNVIACNPNIYTVHKNCFHLHKHDIIGSKVKKYFLQKKKNKNLIISNSIVQYNVTKVDGVKV